MLKAAVRMVSGIASTSKQFRFFQRPALERITHMNEFDKSAFDVSVTMPYLRLTDKRLMANVTKYTKPLLPCKGIVNWKPVREDGPEALKIYIDPDMKDTPEYDNAIAELRRLHGDKIELHEEIVDLTYDNWSVGAALDCILPGEQRAQAFTEVGHICHLNLREENWPYKHIIARILLDKTRCRTIVNKVKNIGEHDNKYRTFGMDLLAGDEDYVTSVSHNGINFTFDFSKVYWNTRLGSEHRRVVEKYIRASSVVYDMFCGVGPFALLALKSARAFVFANDLNPESIKWLRYSLEKNKRIPKPTSITQLDANEFLCSVVAKDLRQRLLDKDDTTNDAHFIMNLPALAPTFLPTFIGLLHDCREQFDDELLEKAPFKIYVHCYLFTKHAEKPKEEAERVVRAQLGNMDIDVVEVHHVRTVSNYKEMICVTFVLPLRVLLHAPLAKEENNTEPDEKRRRIENGDDDD